MINKIINDIKFIRKIDLGGFSSVWLAVHEITHKQLAVKVIPKFLNTDSNNPYKLKDKTLNGEENRDTIDPSIENKDEDNAGSNDDKLKRPQIDLKKKSHFISEINILSKIDHPLVLGYFGDFEDDENNYICMEYVPNGSLLDYINTHSTKGGLKEIVARRLFTELLIAIEYLHKQLKVFHRDLKCENVLIDANNNIRLIDFGFSVIYQNSNDRFNERFGSSGYTCPEMITNVPYTPEKSDVWCLGVILYSMLVGKLPFDGKNDVETAERIAYEEPDYPKSLSKNSIDLLKKILTKNPYRRIDIDSIKRHPFLSQTELLIISRVNPLKSIMSSLDQDILFELSMNDKINVKKLEQHGLSMKFSQEMLMYKQLKRNRDTKLLQEVIEGKIISFDQKKTIKHCEFHIDANEDSDDNISQEVDSDQGMTTSFSMPFSYYASQQINSKMKSNYKNIYVSNPSLRSQHDHRHIPHPESKKNISDSATSNPNLDMLEKVDDSFCDHYVEDTIIDDDDDDEYEQIPKLNLSKPHFGNVRGGISTPNFFELKSHIESENENDSEGLNPRSSHLHRHKHKSKSKKTAKSNLNDKIAQSNDNLSVAFPSTSFSVSSLSTLSRDQTDPNNSKKDLIRIAPRRRSKVAIKDPKSILSFIH